MVHGGSQLLIYPHLLDVLAIDFHWWDRGWFTAGVSGDGCVEDEVTIESLRLLPSTENLEDPEIRWGLGSIWRSSPPQLRLFEGA